MSPEGDHLAHLEPETALVTCEQALRELVKTCLRDRFGNGWLERISKPEQLAKWAERRETESANREKRGVAEVARDLLAYAEFYELLTIVERNWDAVAMALGRQKDTMALLRRFEDLRNTVAHSRVLLPFERDLLAGIAGEIRNRVTLFMSSIDPVGDHYARIEKVSDSFGNEQPSGPFNSMLTGIVVHPGDVVTFRCVGTDPQGRQLTWQILVRMLELDRAKGSETTLSWRVAEHHVSERLIVRIRMASDDARYHRHGGLGIDGYDGDFEFAYRVDPPLA